MVSSSPPLTPATQGPDGEASHRRWSGLGPGLGILKVAGVGSSGDGGRNVCGNLGEAVW